VRLEFTYRLNLRARRHVIRYLFGSLKVALDDALVV